MPLSVEMSRHSRSIDTNSQKRLHTCSSEARSRTNALNYSACSHDTQWAGHESCWTHGSVHIPRVSHGCPVRPFLLQLLALQLQSYRNDALFGMKRVRIADVHRLQWLVSRTVSSLSRCRLVVISLTHNQKVSTMKVETFGLHWKTGFRKYKGIWEFYRCRTFILCLLSSVCW